MGSKTFTLTKNEDFRDSTCRPLTPSDPYFSVKYTYVENTLTDGDGFYGFENCQGVPSIGDFGGDGELFRCTVACHFCATCGSPMENSDFFWPMVFDWLKRESFQYKYVTGGRHLTLVSCDPLSFTDSSTVDCDSDIVSTVVLVENCGSHFDPSPVGIKTPVLSLDGAAFQFDADE
ncbi:MAG: hypothetical protein JNJ77_20020 [Planctomycetia bacterium]|nr:hypothetical protein [Planctomycetia bacterium]